MLLQKFDFQVKDRKGTKNKVADHLSRLEDEVKSEMGEKAEIDDGFLDEHILVASQDSISWFANIVNYLASDIVLSDLTFTRGKSSCMM